MPDLHITLHGNEFHTTGTESFADVHGTVLAWLSAIAGENPQQGQIDALAAALRSQNDALAAAVAATPPVAPS